jgi:hypothetical protein
VLVPKGQLEAALWVISHVLKAELQRSRQNKASTPELVLCAEAQGSYE